MSDNLPVLKGYRVGPSIKVWCPLCAKWHGHGVTDTFLKGRKERCVADCDHYPNGYYIQSFTLDELREIQEYIHLRLKK